MKKLISVILLILIYGGTVFSQESIDLKKAISIAIEKNPSISTIQNNLAIQKLNISSVRGNLYPTLALSGSWSRNNSYSSGGTQLINGIPVFIPDQNTWQSNFNLGLNSQVTLFNGFANYQSIELENQNEAGLKLLLEKTKTDIVLNVYQKFFDAVKKEKIVQTYRANLKNSTDQLEKIKEYVNVGKKTVSEIYKQDVQVAQNELLLEQSLNDFAKSKVDLLYAMNDDLDKNFAVDAGDINADLTVAQLKSILDKSTNINELVKNAVAGRYDYKSAMQDIRINQTKLSLAVKNLWFPSISAFGSYNLTGKEIRNIADSRSFSVGLSLSYYIFQGNKYDISRQIAEVNIKQKSEDIVKLEQQIKSDLKKAILDLETSYKQIEILDRNIKSAEQDKILSEENFRIGYGTLLDVQTAATSLNNLLINRINSIYNFLFAKKQIDYLSGQLNY
ncbi:MAG: TolC family protein [Ignavibacteriae bacterium]|nr:TolC family protein [Ignavibacteriota bacterium]